MACTTSPAANITPVGPGSPDSSNPHSRANDECTKQCEAPSSTKIVTWAHRPVGVTIQPRIRGFTPGSWRFHGLNVELNCSRMAALSACTSLPTMTAAAEAILRCISSRPPPGPSGVVLACARTYWWAGNIGAAGSRCH